MKFRRTVSPLLLLLPVAAVLAQEAIADRESEPGASLLARQALDSVPNGKGYRGLPTKDAPVDGKDGKPHQGPFVETEGATDGTVQELRPLKGQPSDSTLDTDGVKIPQSNDGVMFDKNRDHPQEGTTGTEGGVSEKDRARKAEEGRSGKKATTQPESPKEQSLAHTEQDRMNKDKLQTTVHSEDVVVDGSSSYDGLKKPDDLPDSPHEMVMKIPDSVDNDPLDLSKPLNTAQQTSKTGDEEENDGLYQPFHSFILSFTMILVSEIGDKTFLVACLMAMKHDRMVVFSAAFGALLVMTVLSAVLGHLVPALISRRVTSFLAAGLFVVFGVRLLKEGLDMDPNEGVSAEMHEVEQELAEKEKEMGREGNGAVSQYNLEMGLDGRSRYDSPPGSPSLSPVRKRGPSSQGVKGFFKGTGNLFSLLLSPAWVQTFAMTFLGEWGDRSQIATIAMAAGQDYWWVTLGASCGHAICTGIAVIGGRAIAGRVSLRVVTIGGAVAFLVFGVLYFVEAIWA